MGGCGELREADPHVIDISVNVHRDCRTQTPRQHMMRAHTTCSTLAMECRLALPAWHHYFHF
eukprot:55531-Eustigmatos_ZCMA.PRE.1